MSDQLHSSARIAAEAQAICDSVDFYAVPRRIFKQEGKPDYALEIETVDSPAAQDNKPGSMTIKALCARLSEIDGVGSVALLGAERLNDYVRVPILPNEHNKAEIRRIGTEAKRICEEHGAGATITSVVPERDQYLVDINFWPLEHLPKGTRDSIISDVRKQIQAIPGVSFVIHIAIN